MSITPKKLKTLLNNKTITQEEYKELKAKKDGKSIINYMVAGTLLLVLSPFLTYKALPTWGKLIVILSATILVLLLIEVSIFRKRMKNKYKKRSAFAEHILVGGFAGVYFLYAILTFRWYVNYEKYDYIGVDTYKVLCILYAAELILLAVYIFARIHVCRKIFLTTSKTIKENIIMLLLAVVSMLAISSVFVYGTYVNKNMEKKTVLDLVDYTYNAENDSVKLNCVYHNNSSAEIRKLDSVTVMVKEKSSQKIIQIETFHSVTFNEWSIRGKENGTITLFVPYSLTANRSVWEEKKIDLNITYSIE